MKHTIILVYELQTYVAEHKEVFENLAEDTYNLPAVMAKSQSLNVLKRRCEKYGRRLEHV